MLRAAARILLSTSTRQRAYQWMMQLRHAGLSRRCPVCGAYLRRFMADGDPPRPEARCPVCDAMERHRLIWLYFRERTDLLQGTRALWMLHIAPEPCFVPHFRRVLGRRYVTFDLDLAAPVDVHGNLMFLPWRDATFDAIYCSHVLEHVEDDLAAMRELRRVLRPGGYAILQVPVIRDGPTFEDPSVTDPAERYRLFGQADHVRAYGADYPERLRAVGWMVEADCYAFSLPPAQCRRYGLIPEVIYRAKRSA